MTNEEILKKAVEKACEKGFHGESVAKLPPKEKAELIVGRGGWQIENLILFDHGFAKAFWGEEEVCSRCGENADENWEDGYCKSCCEGIGFDEDPGDMDSEPAWQYHLKNMVILEDPIKYLKQFL